MKKILYSLLIVGLASFSISCGGSDDSASSSGATGTSTATSDNTTSSSESLSGSGVIIVAGLSGNILRSTNKGASFDNASSPTSYNLYGVAPDNSTFVIVGDNGTIV